MKTLIIGRIASLTSGVIGGVLCAHYITYDPNPAAPLVLGGLGSWVFVALLFTIFTRG